MAEIARLLAADDAASILVVTGAGIEPDLTDLNPNAAHALCSLICKLGGGHVTTNFSGVQLLAQPERTDNDPMGAAFVAVHGTIYDQEAGRGGKAGRRRPRCLADAADQPLLKSERLRRVPIPTQDVKDNDPNVVDARNAASGHGLVRRKTLLIMGSSIIKATNGRALHFLDAAPYISRVIFVNPDPSRVAADVASDLAGWGLSQLRPGLAAPAKVECVLMKANEFAEAVLARTEVASLRDCCARWIAPDKVARCRLMFSLPPVEDLSEVGSHKFGAAGVTIRRVYNEVATLNSGAASSLELAGDGTEAAETGTAATATSGRSEDRATKKQRVAESKEFNTDDCS